jgi:hypothetical protein
MSTPQLSPIQPFTENGRVAGARLCQFRTGSSDLLNGHKDWISKYFVPKMQQHPNAWIDFIGYASRTGNKDKNVDLSRRRIAAVEQQIKSLYPNIRVNLRIAEGDADAASFNIPAANDEGYWRAVLIRWYGVPLAIETPVYPPEETYKPKERKYYAPKGCWCIIGVDSFGLPLKAGVSAGKVDLTLLNDKGEQYVLHGYGAGGGLGVDVKPIEAAEEASKAAKVIIQLVNNLKEIGLKAGDLQNISDKIKGLNLTGPSETAGGVFRRLSWEANLSIEDITAAKTFTIGNAEGQFIVAGAEIGFIFFGTPPMEPISSAVSYGILGKPWGYYSSVGLGTMKGALGISGTAYIMTSYEKK